MNDSPKRHGWEEPPTRMDFVVDAAIRTLLWLALKLPYRARVRSVGWFFAYIFGPLTGQTKKAVENLNLVFPEMEPRKHLEYARSCLDNIGRTLIENYSIDDRDFRASLTSADGPGLKTLRECEKSGQPVVLATGHFGNYEAPRNWLRAQGLECAAIYRPMNNRYFNKHYVRTMEAVGQPMFPRGVSGTRSLLKHCRRGGRVVILFDQYMREGEELDFLGRPSMTMTFPAEIALKSKAVLIPFYGIRNDDGISFRAYFGAPIKAGSAIEMSQMLNDVLSAEIVAHPPQWSWVHRRWKVRSQRSRRAAKTGPPFVD
jgi:KDO2-lipid IV(A) lauroyltransferase